MAKGKAKTEDNKALRINGGKLTPKQEEFCELFACGSKDFYGNGVQCYIEVYEPDTSKPNWYKTACQSAYQILSNIEVCKRINELLDAEGFNDENVDRQHLFLINQFSDYKTKMSAIKEYNELKQRIKRKLALEGPDGKPLTVSVIEFVGDNGPTRTEENTNQVS